MGNIRGISCSSMVKCIEKKYGQAGLSKALDKFSEEERKILTGKFSPMKWYSLQLLVDFLAAADKACGKGDGRVGFVTGEYSAETAFGGLYSMFLEFGEPQTIVVRGPFAWKIIHDVGEFELEEVRDNYVRLKISEFGITDAVYSWHLIGYFQKVLEMSGGENVKVKEIKGCGEDCHRFEATWS